MLELNVNGNTSELSTISLVEEPSGITNRKQYWTEEQSEYLVEARQQFPKYTYKDISNMVNLKFGTSYAASECEERFERVADPNLNKGRFTAEEDTKIVELFSKYKGDIKQIAREMGNRQVGQIRRHLQVLGLV